MDEVIHVKNEYRQQRWAELIRQRQESGMTVAGFCEANGIKAKTYYYYYGNCGCGFVSKRWWRCQCHQGSLGVCRLVEQSQFAEEISRWKSETVRRRQ